MKHLFVPYEIALQLKGKGFGLSDNDYLLWFAFYENGVLNNEGIPEANIGRKYDSSPNHLGADTINDFEASVIMMDNSLDDICIAPLYQQVIDWFREKHEIYIWITHYESQWYQFYISVNRKRTIDSYLDLKLSYFNTYLEALNKAIEEALKLI